MRLNLLGLAALSLALLPDVRAQDGPNREQTTARLLTLESELASEHQLIEEQRSELQLLRDTVLSLKAAVTSLEGAKLATPIAVVPTSKSSPDPGARPEASTPLQEVSLQPAGAPLSFQIGGARFTPFGFVDLTLISRSTSVGSGSGTAFGSIPVKAYPIPLSSVQSGNAALDALGGLPETLVSAQNSRLGLRVDTNFKGWDILGYLETDFVGADAFDAVLARASNPLSVRLYFANLRKRNLEVLVGQSWSLMTPNRKGVSPLSSDVFYTVDLDTNYNVGLIWSRSAQFRLTYHPTESWSAAFSLENPQQYVGKLVTVPPALSIYGDLLNNSGIGSAQTLNSVSNAQVPNLIPDIVGKLARDGQIGDHDYHLEFGVLLRHFGVVNPANALRYGVVGGGISINANFQLLQHLGLIVNTFASQGGGRFASGLVPDVVARPNGSLSLVKAYSSLDGFEYGLGNNLLYGYYGLVYGQKNTRICPQCDPSDPTEDYGFGSRNSYYTNRVVSEPTVGFDHTFWRNPSYGQFQFNSQFSYVHRSVWNETGSYPGVNPDVFRQAHAYMLFLNLRYLLP
jgi:hypothetical protein